MLYVQVFTGRHLTVLFKNLAEVISIAETKMPGNVVESYIRRLQKPFHLGEL